MKFIQGRYYKSIVYSKKYLCEEVYEGVDVSYVTLMDLSNNLVVYSHDGELGLWYFPLINFEEELGKL